MSDAVEIVYNAELGRHGVAGRDIAAGELLLVEQPLGWVGGVAGWGDTCQHCLGVLGRTPTPCPAHRPAPRPSPLWTRRGPGLLRSLGPS